MQQVINKSIETKDLPTATPTMECPSTTPTTPLNKHLTTPMEVSDTESVANRRRERRMAGGRRRPRRDPYQTPPRNNSEPTTEQERSLRQLQMQQLEQQLHSQQQQQQPQEEQRRELIIDMVDDSDRMSETSGDGAAVGDSLVAQRTRTTSFEVNTRRSIGMSSSEATPVLPPARLRHRGVSLDTAKLFPAATAAMASSNINNITNGPVPSGAIRPGAFAARGRPADLPSWVIRANEARNPNNNNSACQPERLSFGDNDRTSPGTLQRWLECQQGGQHRGLPTARSGHNRRHSYEDGSELFYHVDADASSVSSSRSFSLSSSQNHQHSQFQNSHATTNDNNNNNQNDAPVAVLVRDASDSSTLDFDELEKSFSCIPPEHRPILYYDAEVSPVPTTTAETALSDDNSSTGTGATRRKKRMNRIFKGIRRATKDATKEMKFLLT